MAKKYILINNEVFIGDVEFHSHLIPAYLKNEKKKFYGGGRFNINEELNRVILYGQSGDFGKPSIEKVKEIFKKHPVKEWEGKEILFSEKEYLSDALKNPMTKIE